MMDVVVFVCSAWMVVLVVLVVLAVVMVAMVMVVTGALVLIPWHVNAFHAWCQGLSNTCRQRHATAATSCCHNQPFPWSEGRMVTWEVQRVPCSTLTRVPCSTQTRMPPCAPSPCAPVEGPQWS